MCILIAVKTYCCALNRGVVLCKSIFQKLSLSSQKIYLLHFKNHAFLELKTVCIQFPGGLPSRHCDQTWPVFFQQDCFVVWFQTVLLCYKIISIKRERGSCEMNGFLCTHVLCKITCSKTYMPRAFQILGLQLVVYWAKAVSLHENTCLCLG